VNSKETRNISHPASSIGLTAGLLVLFVLLIWTAGRAGFASLLTAYAAKANLMTSADAAVKLSPGDPDAHLIRGSLLEANDDLPAAIGEYQTAASLRPDDYVLWLSLERASELNGDSAGAIAAARRALPLAPFYAQPHWQLGNILVRAGQRDEGFNELRLAGKSNPTLLPAIVDLAWHLSGGDAQFVKQAMQPETAESFEALAEYFRRQGAIAEAVEMFRSTGSAGDSARAQFLGELIAARRFGDAYALWSITHPGNAPRTLIDPGFEREQDLNDPGFGWHTDSKAGALTLSLDSANPKDGHSSLRVEFNGDSDPGAAIISQLVLIEPKTHYQIRFAYRTEEIVTGGPPQVFVFDAQDNKVLGHSGALPAKTEGWTDVAIDFLSGDSSEALQIKLARDRCANSTCPIYGRLWLDSFSLQKQ
jgi:hypothetical protein